MTQPPGESVAARNKPASNHSILIVDDSPDVLAVTARLIECLGYTVHAAGSISEALEAASTHSIDLLISDFQLDDGTGVELLQQLNAIKPIKAIALSGYDDADDIARTKAAGFARHLRKPIELPRLEQAISEMLAG